MRWLSYLFVGFRDFPGYLVATLDSQRSQLPLWIPVWFGVGIACWFLLDNPGQWLALIFSACGLSAALAVALIPYPALSLLRRCICLALVLMAAGTSLVWSKSDWTGARPIDRPMVARFHAEVVERVELPARDTVRLYLRTRGQGGVPRRLRVNIAPQHDLAELRPSAVIAVRARLMPPANATLPGAYDFARRAWFGEISATGSSLEPPVIVRKADRQDTLAKARAALSLHVRGQLSGSEGAVAATLATGDRGAIAEADAEAMRNSGLAHLLSISGLHVSALVGAFYLLMIRILASFPPVALRVRLPVIAACTGAMAGIAYTLMTGAQVPTIRACIAAMLVLGALVLGRDPISMRLVAAGAMFVLVLWPEVIVGPSFQLSFAAVASIVALHELPPVKRWFGRREERWPAKIARFVAMLFLTGLVVELTLMPIALYHFHKAGLYGALANIVAIPLTTFVIMPLEALALMLDLVGLGEPVWWLCGQSLSVLLGLAHMVQSTPGSVARLPSMDVAVFALFIAGGLWLFLWRGRLRLLGLSPLAAGALMLTQIDTPDILVGAQGRHLGITTSDGKLFLLRERAGDYTVSTFAENAGVSGEIVPLTQLPGTRCNADFCSVTLDREGANWTLLISRSRMYVPERALAAACKRSDIVVSDRYLPYSCRPRWFKADRAMLGRTGGLAIYLDERKVRSVAAENGQHGWYRPGQ